MRKTEPESTEINKSGVQHRDGFENPPQWSPWNFKDTKRSWQKDFYDAPAIDTDTKK